MNKNIELTQLLPTEQNMSTIGAGSGPGPNSSATQTSSSANQTLSRNNRRRQMNRSRQNIVLYQSDIDWAIKNLVYAVKNDLNLVDLQKDLVYGTFNESQKAKRELESYLYVLENLENNKQIRNAFLFYLRLMITDLKALEIGHYGGILSIALMMTVMVSTGPQVAVVLPFGLLAIAVGAAAIKKGVSRLTNLRETRDFIKAILNKDKKRTIDRNNFIMSHQNTRKNNKNNNNRNNINNNNKSKRRSTIKKQYSPTKPNFYVKNKFSF